MVSNLLEKTAQLEYLELGTLPMCGRTENLEFSLSSLRTLKFGGLCEGMDDFVVLEQLFRAALHLTEIHNVHCDSTVQMTAIRNAGKLHLVSSMIVTDSIETRVCSELTANPPQLTALTMEVHTRTTSHFVIAVKALLAHSAGYIEEAEVLPLTRVFG